MGSSGRLVALGLLLYTLHTHAQSTDSADGFDVTKAPQVVTQAPPGYVGRKTTDREKRIGKVGGPREGDSAEFVLTVGGFVQECPTGDGVATGSFEYLVARDAVDAEPGGTQTSHYANRALATFEGHVKDDAKLDYVDVSAQLTRERPGMPAEQATVQRRFRPGQMGQPDMDAMRDAVAATGDLAMAVIMSMGGSVFGDAELHWNDPKSQCVQFRFDPPTKTRELQANESVDVRTDVVAKNGGAPVVGGRFASNALAGIGRVTPTEGQVQLSPALKFTYTASATPRAGHGFDVAALTRAGVGTAKWEIRPAQRFEGTFSQSMNGSVGAAEIAAAPGLPPALARQLSQSAAAYGIGSTAQRTISGTLVWTPAQGSTRPKTFGDVDSTFYEPASGEIAVEAKQVGQSAAGSCTIAGEKKFLVADLPQAARQFLVLEVAADGRYKMMLGMISMFLQLQATQTCTVKRREMRESVTVNDAGIVLGAQQGALTADGTIEGETPQPIVIGVDRYVGRWSFKRVEPQR